MVIDVLNNSVLLNLFYPPDYQDEKVRREDYYSVEAKLEFSDSPEGSIYVMIAAAVVCTLIVFLNECGLFSKCAEFSCKKVPQPKTDIDFDDDVLSEQQRLKKQTNINQMMRQSYKIGA